METVLRYELSGDGKGLKKWFRWKDVVEHFYHVHSNELTELEQLIHDFLSSPNASVRGGGTPYPERSVGQEVNDGR